MNVLKVKDVCGLIVNFVAKSEKELRVRACHGGGSSVTALTCYNDTNFYKLVCVNVV